MYFILRCRYPSSVAVLRAETTARLFFLSSYLQTTGLPPHADAVDTAIGIATGIMAYRSAGYRTRTQHHTGPSNATRWVGCVLAIDDGIGWARIEGETCKAQESASSNPVTVANLIEGAS